MKKDTIIDDVVGFLKLREDRYLCEYVTEKHLEGENFELTIDAKNDFEHNMELARFICSNFKDILKVMKTAVVEDFSRDDIWNPEGQVLAKDIANSITLGVINVGRDIQYWFEDGNLFGGHSLVVYCNKSNEINYINIEG